MFQLKSFTVRKYKEIKELENEKSVSPRTAAFLKKKDKNTQPKLWLT